MKTFLAVWGERVDGLANWIEKEQLQKETRLVKRELCMLDKMMERHDWIVTDRKHQGRNEQAEKKVE